MTAPYFTRPVVPLPALITALPPSDSSPAINAFRDRLRATRTDWFHETFLDSATAADLVERVTTFAAECVPAFFHVDLVGRSPALLRHGLTHLLRGADEPWRRFARCADSGGPYSLPGLGRRFWACLLAATDPDRLPLWLPELEAGMRRTGVLDAKSGLDSACAAYLKLIYDHPGLTAGRLDAVFLGAAAMIGRELTPRTPEYVAHEARERVSHAVRSVRSRLPLRKRLTDAPDADTSGLGAAAARFDDAFVSSPADPDLLIASLSSDFRSRHRIHPAEFGDVVRELARPADPDPLCQPGFAGFCTDTFRFFADLTANNSREWMDAARPRYQYAVREPLVELGDALAARYVRPVLHGEYGWDLAADPRPGYALSSISRNDFGRSATYLPSLSLAFYPRAAGGRRVSAQFFVRADADGLRYGFLLGPHARAAGRRFRHAVQQHAGALAAALAATAAAGPVTFTADELLTCPVPVRGPEDLRAWALGKTLAAGRFRPAGDPLLRAEELVGDILLTFDRLVPLFAAAVGDDPLPVLARRAGDPDGGPAYDAAAFARDTFLSESWLDRTIGLLKLKRQLVLQGVPGTGKTHVARCLAKLLAGGRADAVHVVQFHPGYGYADFVEGESGDGVLLRAAAAASTRPAEAFVLVIDELTRGHLPTVFGELLYLLEYRNQSVTLPVSKRAARLPENLYIVGTVNTADRATAALDQALRRRFAVVELTPDAAVLARWLDAHPPADPDPAFGPRAVRLFEELNARLLRDFGPSRQFGHSLFMVPGLDAAKLRAVWDSHVLPQVADLATDRAGPPPGYALDRLLGDAGVSAGRVVPAGV